MGRVTKHFLITSVALVGIGGLIALVYKIWKRRENEPIKRRIAPSGKVKITVVTVCYNSEDVISKTIESVLHQDYKGSVEYLIIDGASADSSVSIAESYRPQFEARGYVYRIISEPDHGIYDAMNKGIRAATGELIGFINAGDWYERIALSTVASEYEAEPFDYFYADVKLIKSDDSEIVKHSRMDRIVTSRHWNHPSSFARRGLYDKLGLFRCEGIHDDFEFFLRVRKSDARIRIVNSVLANFMTGGTSNQKSFKKSVNRIKDRYKGYRDNGYSHLYLIECVGIEVAKAVLS